MVARHEFPLPPRVKFRIGQLVATRGVADLPCSILNPVEMAGLLTRHMTGDFGKINPSDDQDDPNDWKQNEAAIKLGRGRVMSVYDQKGTTIWVITDLSDMPGFSVTTFLLPHEY